MTQDQIDAAKKNGEELGVLKAQQKSLLSRVSRLETGVITILSAAFYQVLRAAGFLQ